MGERLPQVCASPAETSRTGMFVFEKEMKVAELTGRQVPTVQLAIACVVSYTVPS